MRNKRKYMYTFAGAALFIAFLAIIPGVIHAGSNTIFLTSGTTWTVPSDWNSSNNTIEVIGGGAGGGNAIAACTNGGGGGGGAYSKISNLALTPGATAYISIGSAGAAQTAGGDTWFNNVNATATSTTGGVLAKGGGAASGMTGGSGGASGSGVGVTRYSGGAGGHGIGNAVSNGGAGGGGAGGPHGIGGAGGSMISGVGAAAGGGGGGGGYAGSDPSGTTGGNGGNNYLVTGGGAGVSIANGTAGTAGGGGSGAGGSGTSGLFVGGTGGAGTDWDSSHGSGGGGGGSAGQNGSTGEPGATGGTYGGGGGGGGCGGTGGAGGSGAQGIIVITYTYGPTITLAGNVKFLGNLAIVGSLTKGSGTFEIDDPVDPANKLLFHSFVESPDVMNVYDGTATLDGNGEVTIQLPAYFDALNGDARYQFFAMDQAMPDLYVKTEEKNNEFTIAGGVPGGEISWQITGIRHDPYIEANPIIPEVEKGPGQLVNKGQCIFAPNCE